MGKVLKIGIVDDNKAFRESLRFFTESILKHQIVLEANDGQHCLTIAYHYIPDILLMDIEMPNIDGLKTTKELIKNKYPAKIIAITNHTGKHLVNELIKTGFKGVIFKNNIHTDLPVALNTVMKEQLFFPTKYY